ncbi:hypothetical protein AORI_4720 [Amycolatopsis keratiniphila]|uniref:Uncharacterized protein n=1 Tax=Amycolatopsis keratiniphila TaxID=129921 RepID=R4SVA8_9PSEU|nr:hypothetical protein AORI_4720 [Amycolatopsis keratiniphila]
MHGERLLVTAAVHDEIPAPPRDTDHLGAEAHPTGERRRQRPQILLGPVRTGRIRVAIGSRPAGVFQQPAGRRSYELGPRREQPHVIPLGHPRARSGPAFQHQRLDTSLGQFGGRRQSHRARSDHHDRQFAHPRAPFIDPARLKRTVSTGID